MLSNHTSDPIESQLREEALYKPYQSLNAYLKKKYGEKIYKIALDGGFTCPNRDGTCGTRGCIFCSAGGSGEFATHKYIAYFQAYTGTYAAPERLYALYHMALSHPKIIGISIATRPDCLPAPVLDVIKQCQMEFPDKFVWIELGLQSVHEKTALYIRRGYPLSCFEEALETLQTMSVPVIVHVILGLPGETQADMLATIDYLSHKNIFGIKLQLLHVLRGTDLAAEYERGVFSCLSKEAYIDLLCSCIDHLNPAIVLHRVTGDGPKDLLIAPIWSLQKRDVLNSLHKALKAGGHYQGRDFGNHRPL